MKAFSRALAVELIAWFLAPAVFLSAYVGHYRAPAASIAPHLRLVLLMWATLALLRIALRLARAGDRAVRIATTALASAVLSGLVLYYALVVIGLTSWARVISWELIQTYVPQAGALAETLGVSLWLIALGLVLFFIGIVALTYRFARRFDWTLPFTRTIRGSVLGVLLAGGAIVCVAEWYNFVALPYTAQLEPLSLTFFFDQASQDLQGQALDPLRAEQLDRLEDEARAAYTPNPAAAKRNVVLIVGDALRPDHLGVTGYARETTPNLSRIAAEQGVRQAPQMRAACTSSVCGLFSMAASKYVHQFSWRPFTLHEALRRHGYRIHLMLSGDHVNFYGLRRMYGPLDSYFDGSMVPWEGSILTKYLYVNDDKIVLDRAAALERWDGTPVMMQFHLMSAHSVSKRYDDYVTFKPAVNYAVKRPGPSDSLEPARNYYDNGVLQTDGVIQRLLETLRAKGYLDNAVVVVTADHGEALGEGGFFTHAQSVSEAELRIPFLMFPFGYRAPSGNFAASGPVSQVDIAPTLLAELGMPRPPTWTGVPLQESRRNDFSYFQQWYAVGLIDRRDPANVWKYWVNGRTTEEHAFNLSRDPQGREDAMGSASVAQKQEWRRRVLEIAAATQSTSATKGMIRSSADPVKASH